MTIPKRTGYVVVGAGIHGLSTAYHLATELAYRGGQGPIVHLEADLRDSVAWADQNRSRWAFTLSAIALSVLGFNLFGDGLRDWLDPKLEGR